MTMENPFLTILALYLCFVRCDNNEGGMVLLPSILNTTIPPSDETLVLTHVIVTHGNRTPDRSELYPTDPYLNEMYEPFGKGQLTKAGKLRQYNVGRDLKERYYRFLGPVYYRDVIEAYSTDYDYTKASLQLILAGLFPPREQDVFKSGILWQAVPFNVLPKEIDRVLLGELCPKYESLYNQSLLDNQVKFDEHLSNVEKIRSHTDLSFTKCLDSYKLYMALTAEKDYGLALPTWATNSDIWSTLEQLALKEYYVAMHTPEMRQLAVGYLMEKLIKDTKDKIFSSNLPGKKMYLYSGHPSTIAKFLISLSIFEHPHIPEHGSWIAGEIHYINKVYGLKIYYNNNFETGPKLLFIPGCGKFCPLDKVFQIINYLIPEEGFCEGDVSH